MSLTIKSTPINFTPAPEGLHLARCYAIVDLGLQTNPHYQTQSNKILFGWELLDKFMDNGIPYVQFQRYTASLNEKSNLRKLVESWRGKGLSAEELEGFHLKSLLGLPCYLTTKQTFDPSNQQYWSKVIGICPLPESIQCPPLNNPLTYFDCDNYTETEYLAVPEGIRKRINLTSQVNSALKHQKEAGHDLPIEL